MASSIIPIIPASKLGTPYQSPSWRYQLTFNPERFGFEKYCSRPSVNSSSLSRLIPNGIQPVALFDIPIYIRQLSDSLPSELYDQLIKVWCKRYFKTRSKKITFNVNIKKSGLINWNMSKLKTINDGYLQKLIRHCFNMEHDEYIAEAFKFYKNDHNNTTCKWINYSIYGGKSDKELAIQWKKPLRFIQALRLIFFDYSAWPKDKLVQYSLIRQMVNNNEMDETDYQAFRRIYDLEDLGLRSILGHQTLTEDERDQVKMYLAGAGIDNLMEQRYAITNLKESVSFNKSISEYANIGLRKIEMEQKAAIMRLTAKQLEKNLGYEDKTEVFVEDDILMKSMREAMTKDNPANYDSIIDIKAEDIETQSNSN